MNSFSIKMIALITMIIDHIGYMGSLTWDDKLYFETFRMIGRISFPLFAFLIAEGCKHSKDLVKYMQRLLIVAMITEIPFLLFSNGFIMPVDMGNSFSYDSRNILFTLFLGVMTVYLYERIKSSEFKKSAIVAPAVVLLTASVAEFASTDYGGRGILLIFLLYLARTKLMKAEVIVFFAFLQLTYNLNPLQYISQISMATNIQFFALTILMIVCINLYNGKREFNFEYLRYFMYPYVAQILATNVQFSIFTIFPIVFICLYNGKLGPKFKYLFYFMYPAHLAVIGVVWFLFFM